MPPVVLWEDPPPPGRGSRNVAHDWPAIVAALRVRPREWARVTTYPSDNSARVMADRLRQGAVAAARPAGSVQAVSRMVDGEYRVYARYVGVPASTVDGAR